MKKIMCLSLLVLTGFLYAQDNFDFNRIKKLSSEQDFRVMMLENGWQRIDDDYSNEYKKSNIGYAFGYNKLDETAKSFSNWHATGFFTIMFTEMIDGTPSTRWLNIINQIKDQCSLYKIKKGYGYEGIYYTCKDSKYRGKIGFYMKDNWYYIQTVHPDF